MEKTNYQSGEKITRQVLNHEVSSTEDAILSRFSDVYQPGAVAGLLSEFSFIAGTNSINSNPSITVGTGVAYNSDGESILISDATIPYNSANPTTTTGDGLGGSTLTPQSTGSLNIPLTTNTTNYIWIDYLQTTDPALFTLHKVTKQKLFYAQQDGYQVGANTSSSTPPAGFSSKAFLLGTVTTNTAVTNGIVATDPVSLRVIFGTLPNRVRVTTPLANKSDVATTYTFAQQMFVDNHVKAIGSGTVTPVNPHGMTAQDMGIEDPGGTAHQRFLHTDGIISPSVSGNASALYLQEHTAGIASENFIEVFPLTANEEAIVNGVTFNSTNIPSSLQFSFVDTNSNPLPDGTYTVYLDSTDRSVKVANPGTFSTGDVTLKRLWTVGWANPTIVPGSKIDYRLFGTTSAANMRFELLGALSTGLATGNRGLTFAYDTGNGNRIIQIGVSGDNGSIAGSITLLTFSYDGPSPTGKVIQVGASYGNRMLLTTITYTGGNLVDSITESVI